ncbi:MAG: hypothetical protein IH624_12935 [Phycisphaerae bacterium]|nr:hypothetical protein [Phycisphaerae bacterium]
MDPWLETLCVVLVALTGVYLGGRAGRLPNPVWSCVLFVPVLMLGLLILLSCTSLFDAAAPLRFITAGRTRYVILCFAISFGLSVPLSRLPSRIERCLVWGLMVVFVALFSVVPFLVPALIRSDLSRIQTRIDADGICYQSKRYTCGPAAAVTALTKYGFSAHEGELAMLARTNPVSGTLLWTLYSAIKDRYSHQGLHCQFRRFNSVAQLRDVGITLVSIREAALLDHCVAVLSVSDTAVTIADPIAGLEVLPVAHFNEIWRRSGIVINNQETN